MEEREFKELNVIPLVDIMLVLLTIVLVTATFIAEGSIPVKLPVSRGGKTKPVKSYSVTITSDGKLFFEKRRLTVKSLDEVVKALPKSSVISVYADRRAQVGILVKVLDTFRRHHIKKVFVKTQVVK